jgi:CRISPR/Cas system Type II protein with McrA/HNH and RuvC-like nuclease domain
MTFKELWKHFFGEQTEVYDYSGRLMKFSDCQNEKSPFCPSVDHIRPVSLGGTDDLGNLIICSEITNREKSNSFPTWVANGKIFQARRIPDQIGAYRIWGQPDGQ